nr:hypothetical protein BaRGS_033518 [Batillaria attramentaria]
MGHQPGRGNEEADRLAKSGSRKEQPQQAVSYTEAKTLVFLRAPEDKIICVDGTLDFAREILHNVIDEDKEQGVY